MKSINKQADNMGGVIRLWAIPPADISIAGKKATILSDTNLVDIYIKEDSASFTEELVKSFAGSSYKVDIAAIVPADTPETLAQIADMERRSKYIVIYLDGNGAYKLAGTSKVPLRFGSKSSTGQGAVALSHYELSFSGLQHKRAVFIENPFA